MDALAGPRACAQLCCDSFPISIEGKTHAEKIEALYLSVSEEPRYTDDAKILAMIIPLDYQARSDGEMQARFTCKWFDAKSRLCTNYENRPGMCSDYPSYGLDENGCDQGCSFVNVMPIYYGLA